MSSHTELYNAVVEQRIDVHEWLMVLRVRPDAGRPQFSPGQYTVLGLGAWEPRVDGVPTDPAVQAAAKAPLVRRAYSISCPVLDADGKLIRCQDVPFLEFYIALVSRTSDHPPMLTPRLFAVQPGQRLFVGPHPHGKYTLDPVHSADDVVFICTGTGEAPHNAMIAELLARGHAGRIASVVCSRYRKDMAYITPHRELEQRYANYKYVTLTTREPENLDPAVPGYVGKQHLQDFVATGRLEAQLGYALRPETCHIYLCGNPAMIGFPHKAPDGHLMFPEPPGLIELFAHRGFPFDTHDGGARIHFEKYW